MAGAVPLVPVTADCCAEPSSAMDDFSRWAADEQRRADDGGRRCRATNDGGGRSDQDATRHVSGRLGNCGFCLTASLSVFFLGGKALLLPSHSLEKNRGPGLRDVPRSRLGESGDRSRLINLETSTARKMCFVCPPSQPPSYVKDPKN